MKNIEQMNDEKKSDIKFKFLEEGIDLNYTTKIKLEFNNWLNIQDPDYMDSVVIQCNKNNIPITGVLLEQLAIASLKRLSREYDYRKKTKVNQDLPYEEAYKLIFQLCHFCSKGREEATLLVASMMCEYYPDHYKKASTLDQGYIKWKRTKGIRELIEYSINERPNGWDEQEQKHFLSLFPEPNMNLQGSRRGSDPYE